MSGQELNTPNLMPVKMSKEIFLAGLKGSAPYLPVEMLNGYLANFIEEEAYEEAAIIKRELETRDGSL